MWPGHIHWPWPAHQVGLILTLLVPLHVGQLLQGLVGRRYITEPSVVRQVFGEYSKWDAWMKSGEAVGVTQYHLGDYLTLQWF